LAPAPYSISTLSLQGRPVSQNAPATNDVLQWNGAAWAPAAASGLVGSLAGDVTGTVPATVVSSVGGKTAAQVGTSVNDTVAATSANTAGTIVKRDGTGSFTASNIIVTQSAGIGQATPVSKLDVNGGATIGSAYSGVTAAPANGAIIQGNVGVGIAVPNHRLHVVGDVRMEGDFVNQEINGAHASAVQNVPFTNGVFNPLSGTTVSVTVQDGNGVNNSGVLLTGFARVFGGTLNGGTSSMGQYFLILQRDTSALFSAPTVLTYTSGICYIETPNGAGSAPIGFGGGGHISYFDGALTPGTTYYYRLSLYPNGVSITSGTYDVYERDLVALQIKR
jgi:hypothetical protein